MSIPRKIFSIWLGDKPSELVERCLKTHQIEGYENRLITLANCFKDHPYLKEALEAKKWVKAADFLRLHYLYEEGGIYLDADMEVLKGFDDLLENEMFVCREENGFVANSAIGSIPGHPVLKASLDEMTSKFKGDDDKIFESGMEIFSHKVDENQDHVKVLSSDFFFPFNHQTGITKSTENTRVYHHFLKSWVPKELPGGWFTPEDTKVYAELLEKLPDGGTFAELGSAMGRSICSVAEIIKRKNLKVIIVDTFEGTENEGQAHFHAKKNDWRAIFLGNIADFGLTDYIQVLQGRTDERVKDVADGSLDLVFIDADHSAEAVHSDILLWKPKLKPEGILSGHDQVWPSVREGYARAGINPAFEANVWFVLPVKPSTKPLFSCVLISRNESKTLPRAIASLKEFQDRGGEIVIVDTGSTDNTAQIAREAGCVVEEVGNRFLTTIDKATADAVNARFIVDGEAPILKEGDTLFDFGSARNYVTSLASNDFVSFMDCDEMFEKLDIDEINKTIQQGFTQLEYLFQFAPTVNFVQSKAYDRRVMKWNGIIHEVLSGPGRRKFLDRSAFFLRHEQNRETDRTGYGRGLALDCFQHQEADRQSHYFARELYYTNRPKSAIKEFERHVAMKRWPTEASQSLCFMGDCYQQIGNEEKAIECWHKAYDLEPGRREPLMRLAQLYYNKNDHQRTVVYAMASLQIPKGDFYANNDELYTHLPHQLLYTSLWWIGRHEDSKFHWEKALEYQPTNSKYLFDAQFYINPPKVSILLPQLGRPEGFERIKKSIEALNYPKELVELIVDDREEPTVPEKVKDMVSKATGDYYLFVANDLELEPDCLIQAVLASRRSGKRLVSLNDSEVSPDEGNICAHFLIAKSLIPEIGGEIFCTRMTHCGVDNLLVAKAKKLGSFMRCELAKATHHHYSKDSAYDWIYERGWKNVDKDREILKEELEKLDSSYA